MLPASVIESRGKSYVSHEVGFRYGCQQTGPEKVVVLFAITDIRVEVHSKSLGDSVNVLNRDLAVPRIVEVGGERLQFQLLANVKHIR